MQYDPSGYASSLYSPVHAANMNPGWGINASLLTPSFQAPYRPAYQGPGAFGPVGAPSYGRSVMNTFGPTPPPMFSNPVDTLAPSFDTLSGNTMDGAIWVGHRVIAPAIAFSAINRALGGNAIGFGGRAWGLGKAVGGGLGSGLARGVGLGAGAQGAVGAATGVAGGILGSTFLPIGLTMAAMKGVEWGVTGYNSSRMMSDDLRENFSGITFADPRYGNVIHGTGLNRATSSRIAGSITGEGIRDMTFSNEEYSALASMTARSGLLDDVNPERIASRIKEVSEQVKLIIGISKDPNLQNAIEALSRLQLSGASVQGGAASAAASSYRRLSMFAGAAGQSIQSVIEGIGAQGEYLYRASGMTPYLGQLAAANTLASFSTAKRMGLISHEQLARMGGVEGASQSALQANMAIRNSPVNQMAAYSEFGLGNASSKSLTEVYNQVASQFSRNPLSAYGDMQLYMNSALSAQEKGGEDVMEKTIQYMVNQGLLQVGPNGKVDPGQAAAALMSQGASIEDVRAGLIEHAIRRDPDAQRMRIQAYLAEEDKQGRTLIEQEGLHTGAILGTAHQIRRGFKSVKGAFADMGSDLAYATGIGGDSLEDWYHTFTTGSSLNKPLSDDASSLSVESLFGGEERAEEGNYLRTGGFFSLEWERNSMLQDRMGEIADVINQLSTKDKDARAFLDATTDEDRAIYLGRVLRNNRDAFGRNKDRLNDTQEFFNFIEASGRVKRVDSIQIDPGNDARRFQEALREAFPDDDLVKGFQISGAAYDLYAKMQGEDGLNPGEAYNLLMTDERYSQLRDEAKKQGVNARGMREFIEERFNRTDNQGLNSLSVKAFELGDQVNRWRTDPSSMQNASARKRMEEAIASGDTRGMDEATTTELVARNSGRSLDQSLKDNLYSQSPEARFRRTQTILDTDRQLQNDRENLQNSIIDSKAFLERQKMIDDRQLQNDQRKLMEQQGRILETWERVVDKEAENAGVSQNSAGWHKYVPPVVMGQLNRIM